MPDSLTDYERGARDMRERAVAGIDRLMHYASKRAKDSHTAHLYEDEGAYKQEAEAYAVGSQLVRDLPLTPAPTEEGERNDAG